MTTRRQRSKAEWRRLVEEHAQSGLNGSAFCKQQGLSRKSFYRNRKALQQAAEATESSGSFVQLRPQSTSRDRSMNGPIEVAYRESRLRLPSDIDPVWLAQLMKALS
jgi:transposase-like protein